MSDRTPDQVSTVKCRECDYEGTPRQLNGHRLKHDREDGQWIEDYDRNQRAAIFHGDPTP